MSNKTDFNIIKQYVEDLGYELISKEYINAKQKLILKDKNNYLYFINHDNLYLGIKPRIVHKNNPYSIHNIKIFLELNNYDFILLSEKYEGEDIPLILLDSEGYYYSQTWRTLLKLTRQLFVSNTNKFSTQNVQLFLNKHNVDLKIINKYKSNKDKLVLKDNSGYLYVQSWGETQYLRMPSLAYKGNPYSIHNINLWCELNNKQYKLLSTTYIRNDKLLSWKCLNENCGEEFKMCWGNISQGQNCSYCKETKGERKIKEVLKEKLVSHDKEYTFDDLVGLKGGLLRFDVPVFWDLNKTKLRMLVEFDGKQHYEWIKKWMTEEEFKTLQIHDQLKNEYCQKHNIKLLRIPYWDYDNIEQILCQELNLPYNSKIEKEAP